MRSLFDGVMRLFPLLVLSVAVLGFFQIKDSFPDPQPGIVKVAALDAEMNAAHAQARASLSRFWLSYDQRLADEKNHELKVRFEATGADGTSGEHMWVTQIVRNWSGSPKPYSGLLSNEPRIATHLTFEQKVDFDDDMITDWQYRRNGKIVGGWTTRVLMARISDVSGSRIAAMFEP